MVDQPANVCGGDIKSAPKFFHGNAPGPVNLFDCVLLSGRKFAPRVQLIKSQAPSRIHILDILRLSGGLQMAGVAATRVIAIVADYQSKGWFAISQNIRNAVRAILLSSKADSAVTKRHALPASPRPALVRAANIDSAPQTLFAGYSHTFVDAGLGTVSASPVSDPPLGGFKRLATLKARGGYRGGFHSMGYIITLPFKQVGSTIAGAGVKVYLIGTRT